MTQSTPKAAPAPIIPNFRREAVANWTASGNSFLPYSAFGRYRMALQNFYYAPSKRDGVPGGSWRAAVKILAVELDAPTVKHYVETKQAAWDKAPEKSKPSKFREKYPDQVKAGAQTELFFPVGRGNTASDLSREDRDDRKLDQFIRVVFKAIGDKEFDTAARIQELVAEGKMSHELLQFDFERLPQYSEKDVVNPATGEVLATVEQTFANDRFYAIEV